MKRHLVFMFLALAAGVVSAQEKSILVTPVTRMVAEFEITSIEIARLPTWRFVIRYRDNLGNEYADSHRGAASEGGTADALVIALNKADLSVKSLERRALEHLVSEGKITAATITGTPR